MIKLINLVRENIDPDKQYVDLLSKLSGGNKTNIEKAWDIAKDDQVKKFKVINKIKNFLKQ